MRYKKAIALLTVVAMVMIGGMPFVKAARSDWKIGVTGDEMTHKAVEGGDQFTTVKGMKYTNDTRFVATKKQATQGTVHIIRLDDIQNLIDTADGWMTVAWLQTQGRLQINNEPSYIEEDAIGFGLEFRFMGQQGKTVKVCLTKYTRDEGGGNDSGQKELEIPENKILKIEIKNDNVYVNDARVNFGRAITSTVNLAGEESYFSVNLHETTGTKSATLTVLEKMPESVAPTTSSTAATTTGSTVVTTSATSGNTTTGGVGTTTAAVSGSTTTDGGSASTTLPSSQTVSTSTQEPLDPGELTLEDIQPGDYYTMSEVPYKIVSVNDGIIEVETKNGKRDFYQLEDFIYGDARKISREEFDGTDSATTPSSSVGEEYGEWEVISEVRKGNQWPWWAIVLTTIGGVAVAEGIAFIVYRATRKKKV